LLASDANDGEMSMTTLPKTKKIELALDQGWLTIALNTPENRNALSEELTAELVAALHAVRDDRTVRGITLRGRGRVFCAGGDLKGFKSGFHGEDSNHARVAASNRKGGEMFALMDSMPQVLLVLVHGAAIAGGLGMVCCGDVVAVTGDAKFSLTETQLGFPPAQIAPYVARRLGVSTARRLMLTGARFTGAHARDLGLADFVAEDEIGFDAIEAGIRRDVMRCAPGANAITKEILLAAPRLSADELMDIAADGFARCMLSDEGREGIASFVEKRKPSWAPLK
jgi:isohexenylglutaconyl-CoA hydratase